MFTLTADRASAHALWVESPSRVEKDENMNFQVFWGHLTDSEDRTIPEITAYHISAGGIINQVEMKEKDNYLKGEISPDFPGLHQLIIRRPASVYQLSLNQYTSRALVLTGKSETEESSASDIISGTLPLEIIPLNKFENIASGNKVEFQVNFRGRPLSETEIELKSLKDPDQTKTYTTDNKGKTEISLPEDEQIILSVNHQLEKEGTKDGYEYEQIEHTHTLYLNLNQ